MVLTDFSKAFDLVDHTLLITKMIDMGVRRSIIPWICDFLHNRQQCVRYNNVLSDYVFLKGGVPQGTKLGPIGFQICINDAAQDSNNEYWKYVDDLTFAENHISTQPSTLQGDLDDFSIWSDNNLFKLNASNVRPSKFVFLKLHHHIAT